MCVHECVREGVQACGQCEGGSAGVPVGMQVCMKRHAGIWD